MKDIIEALLLCVEHVERTTDRWEVRLKADESREALTQRLKSMHEMAVANGLEPAKVLDTAIVGNRICKVL